MLKETDFKVADISLADFGRKEILLAEKEILMNKHFDENTYCLDKNELSDEVDEASINAQTQQKIKFQAREAFYLKKIGKALEAIEKGTYGLCDECDGEISFDRLQARPVAEMCITCKEESEQSENSSFKRSKSSGRTIQELGRR